MTEPRPSWWRRLLRRPTRIRRSENRSLIFDVDGSGAEIRINAKAQRRLKRLLVASLAKKAAAVAVGAVAAIAAWRC